MFIGKVCSAYRGRVIYRRILKKSDAKKPLLMIFLTDDREMVDYAFKYWKILKSKIRFDKTIAIYANEQRLLNDFGFDMNIKMNRRKMHHILDFYCLYQFTENLFIISLSEPDTSKLDCFVENRIISKEEAVLRGIYNLKGEVSCL